MTAKKGQGALEFMILTGFLLLIFSVFFITINERTQDRTNERKNTIIKEIAISVQNEINLASQSIDGYQREFNIPTNIKGEDYIIGIGDDMVYVRTIDEKIAIALPISETTGNLSKGTNKIKKDNGVITLNAE